MIKSAALFILLFIINPLLYGKDNKKFVEGLLANPPKPVPIEIEYREVKGLAAPEYKWHIADTPYWVRLHSSGRSDLEGLDKTKRYKVLGVVLEQNYGTVDIWVQTISDVDKGETK